MSDFYNYGYSVYSAFLSEKKVAAVPADLVEVVEAVFDKIKWKTAVVGEPFSFTLPCARNERDVMLALSGGLDSVYLMFELIERGKRVTAVHVAGLNKSSAKVEEEQARRLAKIAGAEFVTARFSSPAQTFPDNPFKNQLIFSIMLDIGVPRGITQYAIGSDWTTPLSESVTGFTITDSAEVNRAFLKGVQKRCPAVELIFIDDTVKKAQRLEYLYKDQRRALEQVSSCISPLRFRQHLHLQNENKYGVRLMAGRCGSCYKCAMEYILLCERGCIPKDEPFYDHCFDVLANSKTSHRPDLFSKDLPVEKRLENLLNYGS